MLTKNFRIPQRVADDLNYIKLRNSGDRFGDGSIKGFLVVFKNGIRHISYPSDFINGFMQVI